MANKTSALSPSVYWHCDPSLDCRKTPDVSNDALFIFNHCVGCGSLRLCEWVCVWVCICVCQVNAKVKYASRSMLLTLRMCPSTDVRFSFQLRSADSLIDLKFPGDGFGLDWVVIRTSSHLSGPSPTIFPSFFFFKKRRRNDLIWFEWQLCREKGNVGLTKENKKYVWRCKITTRWFFFIFFPGVGNPGACDVCSCIWLQREPPGVPPWLTWGSGFNHRAVEGLGDFLHRGSFYSTEDCV